MNLFEEVKDRVTALQAAKFYGISVKRNWMSGKNATGTCAQDSKMEVAI